MPSAPSAIGRCASAPASRASWTCRRGASCQLVVVPERGRRAAATSPTEPSSSAMSAPANASTACRSVGRAAAQPSVTSARGRRGAGRARAAGAPAGGRARRAADLAQRRRLARQRARRTAPPPRVQVGLARERRRRAARAAWPPRAAAAARRCPGSTANAICRAEQVHPGALQLVERPGLRAASSSQRRIERAGLRAWPVPRPAHARARRAGRRVSVDRALEERRGRGQPAARLRPAGRRSSSAATSSSGPAAPGRGARHAGPDRPRDRWPPPAPVHRAAVLGRRRAVGGRAHERVAEPDPARRTRAGRPSTAGTPRRRSMPSVRPPAGPGAGHRRARPPPAAAAAGSSRAAPASAARKLSSIRPASGARRAARTRRPAPPASGRAAAPAAPAGCRASRR